MIEAVVVMVGIGPRLPVLGPDEFARLWAGRHAELVRQLPGLRRYIQHHAFPGHPHPGFDTLAELYFDSEDDLRSAFRSDYYRKVVGADEAQLVVRDQMTGCRMRSEAEPPGAQPPAALVQFHEADPPPPLSDRGARRLTALPSDRSGFTAIDVIAHASFAAALAGVAAVPGAVVTRPLQVL